MLKILEAQQASQSIQYKNMKDCWKLIHESCDVFPNNQYMLPILGTASLTTLPFKCIPCLMHNLNDDSKLTHCSTKAGAEGVKAALFGKIRLSLSLSLFVPRLALDLVAFLLLVFGLCLCLLSCFFYVSYFFFHSPEFLPFAHQKQAPALVDTASFLIYMQKNP